MKSKTVIFADLDGTLLNREHRISKRTADCLHRLMQLDVLFVPVSARPPLAIRPVLREHGLVCPMIACNGSVLLDEAGNVLLQRGFDVELGQEITLFLETECNQSGWNLYTAEKWLIGDAAHPGILHEQEIVRAEPDLMQQDSLRAADKVCKILCITAPEEQIETLRRLRYRYPQLTVMPSSGWEIEITAPQVDKGQAVQEFCKLLACDRAEAYAFGDNYNDLTMLHAVGHGVLMCNAPVEIDRSGLETTDSNEQDGVAAVLERILRERG